MATNRAKIDDDQRLDTAIDETMRLVELDVPPNSPEWFMLVKAKLDAIKCLAPLLERRAKMHGYDAPPAKQGEDGGSIDAVTRRLEAVR